MTVRCEDCGRGVDAGLFTFGFPILCECGRVLHGPAASPPEGEGRHKMERLAHEADLVCVSILREDLPAIDVVLAALSVRELCAKLFPGQEELFERIYASRFRRLWSQFRPGEPVPRGL